MCHKSLEDIIRIGDTFFNPKIYITAEINAINIRCKKAKKRVKPRWQVLGIAPLNMRSTCQRRFTIAEVVTDQH